MGIEEADGLMKEDLQEKLSYKQWFSLFLNHLPDLNDMNALYHYARENISSVVFGTEIYVYDRDIDKFAKALSEGYLPPVSEIKREVLFKKYAEVIK